MDLLGLRTTEILANCYLLVQNNNRNTRTICEMSSKLTIKTPKLHQNRHHSGVSIVKFKQISHIALVFPLLTPMPTEFNVNY